MEWISFLIGGLVAAPLAALVMLWRVRSALKRARRLSRRARDKDHLVEIAGLTGGLTHEIKNPLSAIKLNLKLLGEDFPGNDADERRRNANRLARIQSEIQRLHDILDEFLKYAGNIELHPQAMDLRLLVEELVDFFRPQAENSGVLLRSQVPSAPVICRIDPVQLKQAVLNLMINADQAMAGGGELLLRLGTAHDRALLEVIDTGPGISPEHRRDVFDAYYSTRAGGSGLGLPTTRRIVRRHEGDITLDGEPGKGTRFIIDLPLAPAG